MRLNARKSVPLIALCSLSMLALGTETVQAVPVKAITWLVPEDPLLDRYAASVVSAFEKIHPGVTVKVITPGSTAYSQKFMALVAAGQTPDVFTHWNSIGVYTLVSHHLVAYLNPYFRAAKTSPSFIPAMYRKEFTQNGELFAIPWNSNPNFLVYNKTLFRKYHIPFLTTSWNNRHWTLNALLQDARQLAHNTSNPAKATWGAVLNPGSLGSLAWLWGADANLSFAPLIFK